MKKSIYIFCIFILILVFAGAFFVGNNKFFTKTQEMAGVKKAKLADSEVQKRQTSPEKHRMGSDFQTETYSPDFVNGKEQIYEEPTIPPHEISDQNGEVEAFTSEENAVLQAALIDSMKKVDIPDEDMENILDSLKPEEISEDISSMSVWGDRSTEEIREELENSLSEEAGASPWDIENMIEGFMEATGMQEQEAEFSEEPPLPIPPPNEDLHS